MRIHVISTDLIVVFVFYQFIAFGGKYKIRMSVIFRQQPESTQRKVICIDRIRIENLIRNIIITLQVIFYGPWPGFRILYTIVSPSLFFVHVAYNIRAVQIIPFAGWGNQREIHHFRWKFE